MPTMRDPNRKPTHPGEILRDDILPALGISQREFAERLGISRRTLSELLHERRTLSPEMAARLGKLLGTSPESWLAMQDAVDLWEVSQDPERLAEIEPLGEVS